MVKIGTQIKQGKYSMQKDNFHAYKHRTIQTHKAKKEGRDTQKAFKHMGKIDTQKKQVKNSMDIHAERQQ